MLVLINYLSLFEIKNVQCKEMTMKNTFLLSCFLCFTNISHKKETYDKNQVHEIVDFNRQLLSRL